MSDFSGESYASWRQHLDRLEKRLTQKGVTVIRVPIDLSEFDFWCAVNRRPRDSEARSDYAAAQMDKPR
ncbi:hypothetical protein DB354_19055 [Opitutus sp. ER46]|nr:hypothetical protein DB354_19055 [Opitutus sp. ER46]